MRVCCTSTCLSFAVAQRIECQESQKPGKESGGVHLDIATTTYIEMGLLLTNYVQRSGYWSGNRTPIPVAIGHVRACHSRGDKVTVSVVSTTHCRTFYRC